MLLKVVAIVLVANAVLLMIWHVIKSAPRCPKHRRRVRLLRDGGRVVYRCPVVDCSWEVEEK